MQHLIDILDQIAEWTGRMVSWLTLIMVIVTCLVVATRYLFDFGSIGLQESVMYMHGVVFMLGIAYTLKSDQHVRVDVLYERFSRRNRAKVNLLGTFAFLFPVAFFIAWSSLDYVTFAWKVKETSGQPGGLPGVYLLKLLIPVMAVTLILQGVAEAARAIHVLVKNP